MPFSILEALLSVHLCSSESSTSLGSAVESQDFFSGSAAVAAGHLVFAHHAKCQLAPQAKCQFCTTGEVSNLHNKQTVRRVRGVGPEGRKQERGEERLGMIGRVGSIGRIPAELVRRWPNRSLRGGMPLASQRERDHTQEKTNACSLRRLAGCPTCFPRAPSRVLPGRESGPFQQQQPSPASPASPAPPVPWAASKSADPVERVGSCKKESS